MPTLNLLGKSYIYTFSDDDDGDDDDDTGEVAFEETSEIEKKEDRTSRRPLRMEKVNTMIVRNTIVITVVHVLLIEANPEKERSCTRSDLVT